MKPKTNKQNKQTNTHTHTLSALETCQSVRVRLSPTWRRNASLDRGCGGFVIRLGFGPWDSGRWVVWFRVEGLGLTVYVGAEDSCGFEDSCS